MTISQESQSVQTIPGLMSAPDFMGDGLNHPPLGSPQPYSRRSFLKQSLWAAGALAIASPVIESVNKALAHVNDSPPGGAIPKNHPLFKGHQTVEGGVALLEQETLNSLTTKDFSHLLGGTVSGLSDKQLTQHFKLYDNYVKKTNTLNEKLSNLSQAALDGANTSSSELRDLLVARSFTLNGAVLHELYFGNLGSKGTGPSASFDALIKRDFGSFEAFTAQLKATGKAARGWALLALDLRDGHLKLFGMDEHHAQVPVLTYPILAMDVYEHAYMIDYGIQRADYLDTFVKNINWEAVHKRLIFAVHHLQTGPNVTA